MAVIINAKGTSVPYFKIGKQGTTLYQGDTDPNNTYTVSTNDVWIDSSNETIKFRTSSSTWSELASTSTISDLTDIDLTGIADGYFLRYDSASSTWKPHEFSGGLASNWGEITTAATSYDGYTGDVWGVNTGTSTASYDDNVSVGGTLSVAGDLTMTGHILPSANITYDLGSTTHMWKDVYIGPGSLYINGQKVIEDSSGTIIVSADENQNLQIETTGTGDVSLTTATGGKVEIGGTLEIAAGKNVTSSDGNAISFTDGLDMNGEAISNTSTVDGRDVGVDGTKLDTIEASATADQTAAEIVALVESGTDSNTFTDADHTKLDGIEASATTDQTQSEINALGITATGLSGTPDVTVGTVSSGNITTSGYLRGPSSFTIDPATHGDDTGTVVVAGNLQVDGTTTTINSTTVAIDDLNFSIATDAADSAAANGAGITIGGAGATLNYTHATTSWDMNKPLNVTGDIGVSGTVDGVDIATRDGVLTSTTTTANAALPKAGGTLTGNLIGTTADFFSAGNGNSPIFHVKDTADTFTALFEGNRAGDPGTFVAIRHFPSTADTNNNSRLSFQMKDDGDNITNYGTIGCFIDDNTGGTEDGNLRFSIMKNGTSTETMRINSSGVDVTGTIQADNLTMLDNEYIRLGNSHDLQIYHDGLSSYIKDSGTGDLVISGANVRVSNVADSSNHIRCADGGSVKLYHNGSDKLETTSTGIDVTGNIDLDNGSEIKFGGTAEYIHSSTANNYIRFFTNSLESLRIKDGKVGIGESSPDMPLHITKTIDTAYNTANVTSNDNNLLKLENPSSTANAFAGMQFRIGSGADMYFGAEQKTGNDGDFYFANQGAPNSEMMRITSSGNVGIGTSSPQTQLHIENSGGNASAQLTSGTSGTSYINMGDTGNADAGQISYINNDDAMAFTVNASERMRIDDSGNVNITQGGKHLRLAYNNSTSHSAYHGWNYTQMGNNGGNYIIGGSTATGGHLKFVVNNTTEISSDNASSHNGTVAMIIDSSGKVALGGSTAVTSDSQVAIHGGNLELTTAGAKYWIPRASDGALTGSLYSPSGSALRLSGAGTGSGSIEFEPSSSSGVAMNIDNSGIVLTSGSLRKHNGVNKWSWSGNAYNNASFSVSIPHGGKAGIYHIRAMHTHHAISSYGCLWEGFIAVYHGHPGIQTTVNNHNITSSGGGSWTVTRGATADPIVITKNAGTYIGNGQYSIEVTRG